MIKLLVCAVLEVHHLACFSNRVVFIFRYFLSNLSNCTCHRGILFPGYGVVILFLIYLVNFLITRMSGDESQPIEFEGFSDEHSMEADASADVSTHPSYSTQDIPFGRDSRSLVVISQVELVLVTSPRVYRSPRICRIWRSKPLS